MFQREELFQELGAERNQVSAGIGEGSLSGFPLLSRLSDPTDDVIYVVAEATDGYRVLFALAELDADFMNSEVLVADTLDGAPIDAKRGPFRLVAPHDKRPARWVRMLKSITVSSGKELN